MTDQEQPPAETGSQPPASGGDPSGAPGSDPPAAEPRESEPPAAGAPSGPPDEAPARAAAAPAGGPASGIATIAGVALAGLGLVVLLLWASQRVRPAPGGQARPVDSAAAASDPAAEEMNAGLRARDPNVAVSHFRRALEHNPSHYGASYQLARALDLAGRRDDARPIWERVLRMAEQYGDGEVAGAARARLSGEAAAGDPMKAGLDALYTRKDPAAAAARFREVLARTPDHYGATYQLATALDQANEPLAAKPVWEKVLEMATAHADTPTVERARARLAEISRLPGASPADAAAAGAMKLGLEALYTKGDAAAAVKHFKKALAEDPKHYGATFQLATALDEAGKPAEARPVWKKVLEMATAIDDAKTVEAARARLARKP